MKSLFEKLSSRWIKLLDLLQKTHFSSWSVQNILRNPSLNPATVESKKLDSWEEILYALLNKEVFLLDGKLSYIPVFFTLPSLVQTRLLLLLQWDYSKVHPATLHNFIDQIENQNGGTLWHKESLRQLKNLLSEESAFISKTGETTRTWRSYYMFSGNLRTVAVDLAETLKDTGSEGHTCKSEEEKNRLLSSESSRRQQDQNQNMCTVDVIVIDDESSDDSCCKRLRGNNKKRTKIKAEHSKGSCSIADTHMRGEVGSEILPSDTAFRQRNLSKGGQVHLMTQKDEHVNKDCFVGGTNSVAELKSPAKKIVKFNGEKYWEDKTENTKAVEETFLNCLEISSSLSPGEKKPHVVLGKRKKELMSHDLEKVRFDSEFQEKLFSLGEICRSDSKDVSTRSDAWACLLTLKEDEVEQACKFLNLFEVCEDKLIAVCDSLPWSQISHKSAEILIQNIFMARLMTLRDRASHTLLTALTPVVKAKPMAMLNALVRPLTQREPGYQFQLLTEICKDLLPADCCGYLIQQLCSSYIGVNEQLVQLLQTIVGRKPELDPQTMALLTSLLVKMDLEMTSSVKFGKLLLMVISQWGKKLKIDAVMTLVNRHKSSFKRPLQIAFKKLMS